MLKKKQTMEDVVEQICKEMAENKEKNLALARQQMRRNLLQNDCNVWRQDKNGYIEEGRFDEWKMLVGIKG